MKPYLDLVRNIKENGIKRPDRTGTGRQSIFGTSTRYDLSDGTLPIVTTRQIFTKGFIQELLWFISGSFDNKVLNDAGVNIWNQWSVGEDDIKYFIEKYIDEKEMHGPAREHLIEKHLNSIGKMYGGMWRYAPQATSSNFWPTVPMEDLPSDKVATWTKEYEEIMYLSREKPDMELIDYCTMSYYKHVDQLNELILNLKKRPYSARHCVTAWVPSHIPFEDLTPQENVMLNKGALAPCPSFFQCFVNPPLIEGDKPRLSLQLYQRSCDFIVGSAFNIGQYSLLLAMLAHVTDMEPFEFIYSTGDTHLYLDQLPLIDEQLSREPLPLPKLWLNPEVKDIFKFTIDDIKILDYQSHPKIVYPVSK